MSLEAGEMYVKGGLQVVVFFWEGDSLGLRTCNQMTGLEGIIENIVPVAAPGCTVPSTQDQLGPRPVQVQGRRQIRGQGC